MTLAIPVSQLQQVETLSREMKGNQVRAAKERYCQQRSILPVTPWIGTEAHVMPSFSEVMMTSK